MATIKPTREAVNKRIHQISELKAKIDKISVLEKGKDSDFWIVLKEFLTDAIKRYTEDIDALLDQDDIPSDMSLGALKKRHGLKFGANAIISLMESPDEVRAQYNVQIKVLEQQIKDAQDSGILEPQGE